MALADEADLAARCRLIELLVVDVDGVLTDGVVVLNDLGVESKHFSVRDGFGFHLWKREGKRSAILSGRKAALVEIRARELGINPVVQGAALKREPFLEIVRNLGFRLDQVCYIGDDLIDVPVLTLAGLSACPSDGDRYARASAHYVTQAPGGRGVVREVIELILHHQGRWDAIERTYRYAPENLQSPQVDADPNLGDNRGGSP